MNFLVKGKHFVVLLFFLGVNFSVNAAANGDKITATVGGKTANFYITNVSSKTCSMGNGENAGFATADQAGVAATVTIPKTVTSGGVTYTVTEIKKFAFYGCTNLTTVSWSPTIANVYVRASAFQGCTKLATVTLTNTSGNIGIEASAFSGCSALATFKLTSNAITIPEQLFYSGFSKLATVTLKANTGATTIKKYAFGNYQTVPSQVLTLSVTSAGAVNMQQYSFYNRKVKALSLSPAAGNITVGKYAFYGNGGGLQGAVNLKSVAAITVDTAAFYGNTAMTTVTMNAGTNMTVYYHAFQDATNLTSINLTATNTLTLKSYSFTSAMSGSTVGSTTLKGNTISIERSAFLHTRAMKNATIESTGTGNITLGEYAFNRNHDGPIASLRSAGGTISIKGAGNITIGKQAFCLWTNANNISIIGTNATKTITIGQFAFYDTFYGSKDNGVLNINGPITRIEDYAFDFRLGGISGEENITDDDGTRNPVFVAKGARSCLKTATITNTKSADLTIGVSAFRRQFSWGTAGTLTITGRIKLIDKNAFTGIPYASYTSLKDAIFSGLKTININNSGSSKMVIRENAFAYTAYNSGLTGGSATIKGPLDSIAQYGFYKSINLQTWTTETTTPFVVGRLAFGECGLTSIRSIESGTTKTNTLPSTIRAIGNQAFYKNKLTTITIPALKFYGLNTYTATVDGTAVPASATAEDVWNANSLLGSSVFEGNANLTTVNINTNTTGNYTFKDCTKLANVTLGANLKYIQTYVFQNCTALKKLDVPANVVAVDNRIFDGCTQNIRLNFKGTQPPVAHSSAFRSSSSEYANVHIVVPYGCVAAYNFSANSGGFQNVKNDNISCEYALSATSTGWGSISSPNKTTKEYAASFSGLRLTSLTWKSASNRGTFCDLYDLKRTGVSDNSNIVTNVAATLKAYSADYYYKSSGKVGTDQVVCGLLPSGTNGYITQGEAGRTYYMRVYTEKRNLGEKRVGYTIGTYNNIVNSANNLFKAENIRKPGPFRVAGETTYARSTAPNLVLAGPATITQGATKTLPLHGTVPCYFYGLSGGVFKKITNGTAVKEGKAYVAIPIKLMDESNSAKFEMLFDDDMNGDDENETTGIEAVISEAENNSEIWYSLKGERLSGKPTQKGLYICNGKKVIIK